MGWDAQFHFKRIMELKDSIMHLQVLPNYSFNEFHGSSVMSLYPYFNLFPYVILSFFVKSNLTLVYFSFIFNTFLTFVISFYSCKNYTRYYFTSYVFSLIYSLSTVFLSYNLIGNDFGIISTYILLPLIIFGFLNLFQNKNSWLQLSLGMSLLLFSHVINIIIISIFLLIYLLINFNNINKNIILQIFKSILIFLLITSIVWMPLLKIYVFNNLNMPYTAQLNRIGIREFLSGIYGGKSTGTIGFFPIMSTIISIVFYKKFNKYIKQMYILSILIVISVLFLPWKFITTYGVFKLLNQFQFTFRFLIIPQMTLSFIFALIITKYIISNNLKKIVIIGSMCSLFTLQVLMGQYMMIHNFSSRPFLINYIKSNGRFIKMDNVLHYKINTSYQFNVMLNTHYYADDDYIPKASLPISSYVNHNLGFYDNNHKIKVNNTGYNQFNFSGENSINKLSLPIYAYNKEKLFVYLNGSKVNNYTNKNGLLTINNIHSSIKPNNKLLIKPVPDPFRIIGAILSIFGWIFSLGIIIKEKFVH